MNLTGPTRRPSRGALAIALLVTLSIPLIGCSPSKNAPAQGDLPGVPIYTTDFPITENPISEGGKWLNGATTGVDWADVQTASNKASGTGPQNAGAKQFADPTAVLSSTWPSDQYAQAVVSAGSLGGNCCKEVELAMRASVSAHSITGYFMDCSLIDGYNYMEFGTYNGPLNDFSTLARTTAFHCVDGDVLTMTASGNVITVYRNGTQVLQATDSTFSTGSPGVGFYNSADSTWTNFGLKNFVAGRLSSTVGAANLGGRFD
jgi:hypothetical protein